MFERFVVGFVICIGMIALSGWGSSDGVTAGEFNTAISVLKDDLKKEHQNEMNVLNSLLQRIRKLEKRMKVIPSKKYRIAVDGKEL